MWDDIYDTLDTEIEKIYTNIYNEFNKTSQITGKKGASLGYMMAAGFAFGSETLGSGLDGLTDAFDNAVKAIYAAGYGYAGELTDGEPADPFATRAGQASFNKMINTSWNGSDSYRTALKNQFDSLRNEISNVNPANKRKEGLAAIDAYKNNALSFAKAQLAHFAAQGVLDGAEASGIDRYMYVAVMDAKTSRICRDLDGKVFKVSDAKPFVNMPPMHINCRSGVAPFPNGVDAQKVDAFVKMVSDFEDSINDPLVNRNPKNPSVYESVSYIIMKAGELGIPVDLALATAFRESEFLQFNRIGEVFEPKLNGIGGGFGIMQIQESEHPEWDSERYKNVWQYNIDCGLNYLSEAYTTAKKETGYTGDDLARSAYSLYNGGTNSDPDRWKNENAEYHENDVGFMGMLDKVNTIY